MPPRSQKLQLPDPNQGEFFTVVSSSHDGITTARIAPATEPGTVEAITETIYHVDTRERAGHLLTALTHLANAAMSGGMLRAQHTGERQSFEKRYHPAELDSRVQHAGHAKKSQPDFAKKDFLRAYNLGRAEPVGEDDVDFSDAYIIFRGMYGVGSSKTDSERRRQNRDRLKRNLTKVAKIPGPKQPYQEVEVLEGSADSVMPEEVYAPVDGATPTHIHEKAPGRELEKLKSIRKELRGVIPIVPATYDEMHDLYAIMTEPTLNAHNALMNLYDKVTAGGRSKAREDMANRAVASAIYRMDDYRVDALQSYKALHELQHSLIGVAPNTQLAGLIDGTSVGIRVYAKHKIIEMLMQEVSDMPGFDLLRAQSVPAHPDMIAGLEVHQGNQYTGKPTKALIKFVDNLLQSVTVGELLEDLPKFQSLEALRGDTWTVALREVAGQFRKFAQESSAVRAS